MDWKTAMEVEQAMLKRIAALLLALADLAELSCTRSGAVRAFVLWLLLPAEALVRNLVTGRPGTIPLRQAGNDPADAMRLASSFRSLATAVLDLSRLALPCANDPDGPHGERPGVPILEMPLAEMAPIALRAWKRTPHDTS